MDTHLADFIRDTPEGKTAESILRKCVHCGFCTATCPTYQILGDELDSPRGRIYLIKQVLEGQPVTRQTQVHLDRCLTCRNCESTCPSGVKYGQLIDIGRKVVDERVERPLGERMKRSALKGLMTNRTLFENGMVLGRAFRPLAPPSIKNKINTARPARAWPGTQRTRKVLILNGCVQPAMLPSIDAATVRVLDALGIQCMVAPNSGCCGAVKFHMNDHKGGLAQMRQNIDAWWPLIERGEVEGRVMNASGCGVTVREYAHHFAHDPAYQQKAERISSLTMDLSQTLLKALDNAQDNALGTLRSAVTAHSAYKRLAFHPPCTLQHGQQIKGVVENVLTKLGFELTPVMDSHLCCGSAGTYSVLQPVLSSELKKRKVQNLEAGQPQAVVSANIGCITHIETGTALPVRHWIELIDDALTAAGHA